ncbi:MAG: AAC(3) family N-acetyltransferase [Clostridia bacterium]|nr:AAC(3) family N-acetyltransferase [Clostridia bacterium]
MMEGFRIRRNDKVTVHSSLRKIGEIEGGADGLLNAMIEYLDGGLLIIPTHTWDSIGATRYYNVKETKPCVGILSQIAAFRKDGVRSLHPSHSVAVFGKGADEFIRGEETCNTPTPKNSCLGRLYEENGKILLLGVGLESCTFLHSVDERFNIPNRLSRDSIPVKVVDYDGNEIVIPDFHWFYTQSVPEGCSEHFGNYEKALLYCGAMSESSLGNAKCFCLDARKTADTVKMLWDKADYDLCSKDREIPEFYYKF